MNNLFVIDKFMMSQVINGLKTLKLNNYDDYCKIVGIVSLLEQAMQQKPTDESQPEEVKTDG